MYVCVYIYICIDILMLIRKKGKASLKQSRPTFVRSCNLVNNSLAEHCILILQKQYYQLAYSCCQAEHINKTG